LAPRKTKPCSQGFLLLVTLSKPSETHKQSHIPLQPHLKIPNKTFKPGSTVVLALSIVTDRGSKLLIRRKGKGSFGEETALRGIVLHHGWEKDGMRPVHSMTDLYGESREAECFHV